MNICCIHKKCFMHFYFFVKILIGDDKMDCIFCKIINNEIPSYSLYEDDIVKVFLDINPSTNGHCLIIPKKHYTNIDDIEIDTLNHINKIAKDMYSLLKEKLSCDGLTISQNNDYGQEVKHYHMHLTPRYKKDGWEHHYNKNELKPVEEVFKTIKGE